MLGPFLAVLVLAAGPQAALATPTEAELNQINSEVERDGGLDGFEFGNTKLYFPNQSQDARLRARLAELPPERVARVQAIRRWVVQHSGSLLMKFQKPIGAFSSVKGKAQKLIPNKRNFRRWFGHPDSAPSSDQLQLEAAAETARLPKEKVAGILATINSFLLESSAVMATAEEQGIMFSIGLQGEIGGGRFGRGGAVSLDVFLGYNRRTQSIVIALLPRVESFKDGLTGSFGAPVKLEYYWITANAEQVGHRLNGTAIYPPGLPVGSFVSELSAGGYAAMGVFGLIGADFSGGALPLVNRTRGIRTMKISIPVGRSKLADGLIEFALKKFLNHIVGDLKTMFVAEPVEDANPQSASCEQALTP
jgi:hypothetical protein